MLPCFSLVPHCVVDRLQNTLTKTLKSLEGRHLIKTAKSVKSKSKKLYMLYELSEFATRASPDCLACRRASLDGLSFPLYMDMP